MKVSLVIILLAISSVSYAGGPLNSGFMTAKKDKALALKATDIDNPRTYTIHVAAFEGNKRIGEFKGMQGETVDSTTYFLQEGNPDCVLKASWKRSPDNQKDVLRLDSIKCNKRHEIITTFNGDYLYFESAGEKQQVADENNPSALFDYFSDKRNIDNEITKIDGMIKDINEEKFDDSYAIYCSKLRAKLKIADDWIVSKPANDKTIAFLQVVIPLNDALKRFEQSSKKYKNKELHQTAFNGDFIFYQITKNDNNVSVDEKLRSNGYKRLTPKDENGRSNEIYTDDGRHIDERNTSVLCFFCDQPGFEWEKFASINEEVRRLRLVKTEPLSYYYIYYRNEHPRKVAAYYSSEGKLVKLDVDLGEAGIRKNVFEVFINKYGPPSRKEGNSLSSNVLWENDVNVAAINSYNVLSIIYKQAWNDLYAKVQKLASEKIARDKNKSIEGF